jgi:predicted small metal-binding protein
MKRVRCACGWEITGPQDDIVPLVIEHGEKFHNMKATPEQVIATLESVEARESDQSA